jgi:VCBS repeat-containing protein
VLPPGLVVATPNGLNLGTCAAASPVVTATPGSNTITLGNQPLNAGGGNTGGVTLTNSGGAFDNCSFSVNVTAASAGSYLNTVGTAFGGAYPLVSNDGNAGSATLNVTVSNTPPVANADTYSVNQDTVLSVAAPGVLVNDTDADHDALTAVLVTNAAHGNVVLNSDGSFTYTPNPGFACATDTFSYKANDGTADSNVVADTINVLDTQPPSISASVAVPLLWPANHDLVNVGLTFNAVDSGCGGVTTALAVFSDEADVNGDADGNFSPDAKDVAAGTLRLRAERASSEGANGRVYLVRVTASDSSSNTGSKCVAVVVPKDNSASAVNAVKARGLADAAQCTATGLPPAGYVAVGAGPVIGPKQ